MVDKCIIDSINAITDIISNTIKAIPILISVLLSLPASVRLSTIKLHKRNKTAIKTTDINDINITDYFLRRSK